MKLTMICLSVFVAAASSAPQFPFFPAIGSPLLPVQPFAQDELGRLVPPGGLVYPGAQENIQIRELLKPVAPVQPTPAKELKPKELLSSTPTVAERYRCSQDYRKIKYEVPAGEGVQFKVGSNIASKNQFPFLVALFEFDDNAKDYTLTCGASLISPTKILTAAHCVTKIQYDYPYNFQERAANRFQVKLGMNFMNTTTNDAQQTRNIANITLHEEYRAFPSSFLNDVAVLTMDKPVQYTDTISPVCLVPDCINDDNELDVTVMGWGDTKTLAAFFIDNPESLGKNYGYLKFADFSTLPRAKCEKVYGKEFGADQMLCTYKEGKDTCQNDIGGPLVIDVNKGRLSSGFENSCRFMQVGVFSYGDECAKMGSPGINARVKNFLPWILEHSK